MITQNDLDNRFTYHPPKGNQGDIYAAIRSKAKELAELIVASSKDSRELSLSITKLEECVMWANAGISRSE
ncbi:MAG TPA: hypothetical protein VNX68_03040 [Nitrosopumilaceae archaeon]|nr:hypothetical protein [Nitrosopumilaceae archaeon]